MEFKIGDKIGIIALSGDCEKENVLLAGKNLEALGYKVEFSKNIFDKKNYLAGDDDLKIDEFHRFLKNPEIKLIMAARGGYGAIRLINRIDYDLIKNNPKIICGYSDFTAILLMVYKKTGIITYHSPMAVSDWGVEEYSSYTSKNFFDSISREESVYSAEKIYKTGNSKGVLWGGNLSTVVSLCGQDFIPSKDFIFFAEDINEPVYKIDKMFRQLLNISEFKEHCKGIILGDFLGVDNEIWLDEYLNGLALELEIPILSGFPISHGRDKITLPVGSLAEINEEILKIKI